MIREDTRALVVNLEGKHELHGEIVYVESLIYDHINQEEIVWGVIGSNYPFEYKIQGKNLLTLDDEDDLIIELYSNWETF